MKDRAGTIKELADAAVYFYRQLHPSDELRAQHYTAEILPAMKALREQLASVDWDKASLASAIKQTLTAHSIKMPKLAMPLRVLLTGRSQTPSIDATIELLGRETVLGRLSHYLDSD